MRCLRDNPAEVRVSDLLAALIAIQCALWLPSKSNAQDVAIAPDTLAIAPLATSQSIRLLLEDANNIDYLRETIRDEDGWERFWDRMVGHGARAPRRPSVDFSREMVILASNGETKNYNTVAIAKVVVGRDSLEVHVLTRVNVPPGCYYDAVYSPLAIVRVPRNELPVQFVDDRIDEKCGYKLPLRPPPRKQSASAFP